MSGGAGPRSATSSPLTLDLTLDQLSLILKRQDGTILRLAVRGREVALWAAVSVVLRIRYRPIHRCPSWGILARLRTRKEAGVQRTRRVYVRRVEQTAYHAGRGPAPLADDLNIYPTPLHLVEVTYTNKGTDPALDRS
jgi:hypothetical protein